ncbi:MAG: protein kinase [Planctomycetota bacterium]
MNEGRLVIRSLTGAERVSSLPPGRPQVLGRSRFCDLVVDDKHVARRHLRVEFQGSQCRMESVGKEPFSYKGQNKLAALLKNGDSIRIGNHEIVFYLPESHEEPSEPAPSTRGSPERGHPPYTQIKLRLPRNKLIVYERVATRVEALLAKGEKTELTEGFHFEITPPGSLIVNADRELVPMKTGPARVAVRMGPWFDVAEVVVEDPVLDSLVLLVPPEPVSEGEEFSVQVMGLHTDAQGKRAEMAVTHLCQFKAEPESALESLEHAGRLRALRAGAFTLQAMLAGVESPSVKRRIEPPVLKALALTLPSWVIEAGTRVPLLVEGVWSHGRREPYAEEVTWQISSPSVVAVKQGFLEALEPGPCTLRAVTAFLSSDPLEVEVRVGSFKEGGLVLPDEMAPQARSRPVTRVLTVDGHTWDVTTLSTLESDNPKVLRVLPDGAIEALVEGMATVTARYNEVPFTKSVKVTRSPRKADVSVYRELLAHGLDEQLPVGLSTRIVATGILHDGSQNEVPESEILLTSLTPTLLSCRGAEVVALAPGPAKVRVEHGPLHIERVITVVGPRIVRLKFDPPSLVVKPDERSVVRAFALSSDGRETEVTHLARWTVPRGLIGSPRTGSVQAVVAGVYELLCEYGGLTKSLTLTANDEELPDDDPNRYGDLRLIGVVGVGGMGRVFRAERVEDGKPFALKTLRNRYLSSASMVERFLHEAQILHSFQHPHIVKVFRCGKKAERPFMVMEFLEGETLAGVVKRKGPLPFQLAVAMVRDVSRALHVLHAKKAVHRDVKPGNIFLTRDGVVKLMDFGIARSDGDATAQTAHAARLVGTASYVAPEQARASQSADARSDLYSLGATFFALLTGRPPYLGESGLEIVLQHLNAPVPDVRTLARETPPEVAAMVSRLLAKDPGARPQSAAEVALSLELIASDVDLRECFL